MRGLLSRLYDYLVEDLPQSDTRLVDVEIYGSEAARLGRQFNLHPRLVQSFRQGHEKQGISHDAARETAYLTKRQKTSLTPV